MSTTTSTPAAAALAAFTASQDSHHALVREQAAEHTAYDSFMGVPHMVVPEVLAAANLPAVVTHGDYVGECALDPDTMKVGVAVTSGGTRLEVTGDLDLRDTFSEAAARDLFTRAFALYEDALRAAAAGNLTLAD